MPRRLFWLATGLISTACGIAGIVLPLVPTTPFLLLAAYAFARSSPGLYVWLVRHPRLGPPIRNWRRNRAISRKAKALAVLSMAAALVITVALGFPSHILLIQAVVMVPVAAFVLTRPSGPSV